MRKRLAPNFYQALLDFDISYQPREVNHFLRRWEEGVDITEIHKELVKWNNERTIDEVIILAFDLSYNELIEPRKHGIFGG